MKKVRVLIEKLMNTKSFVPTITFYVTLLMMYSNVTKNFKKISSVTSLFSYCINKPEDSIIALLLGLIISVFILIFSLVPIVSIFDIVTQRINLNWTEALVKTFVSIVLFVFGVGILKGYMLIIYVLVILLIFVFNN